MDGELCTQGFSCLVERCEGDGKTGIWIGGDEDESRSSVAAIRRSPELQLGAHIMIILTVENESHPLP